MLEHLRGHVRHDDAELLTASDVRGWHDSLLASGKAPKTVQDVYLAALKAVLDLAVSQEALEKNVAADIKVRARAKTIARDRGFSDDEAGLVLSATLSSKNSEGLDLPSDARGVPRVDDRRVIGGIVPVIESGGRRVDAPASHGPRKTLHNRFVRWAEKGVWADLFAALAAAGGPPAEALIDGSAVRAHRAASGGKGGSGAKLSDAAEAGARPRSTALTDAACRPIAFAAPRRPSVLHHRRQRGGPRGRQGAACPAGSDGRAACRTEGPR